MSTWIGNFAELTYLSLHSNSLTGHLPPGLMCNETSPNLRFLDLHNNSLSTALNQTCTLPTKLIFVSLHGNNITGPLPVVWQHAADLQYLFMHNMHLQGQLPSQWGAVKALPQLRVLDLGDNILTGHLPAINNTKLQVLLLNGNAFSGPVDQFWCSNASELQMINASNNPLSGPLPAGNLSAMPHLFMLSMKPSSNSSGFAGQVPISWFNRQQVLNSSVKLLQLGSVWSSSKEFREWRKQVCLNRDRYQTVELSSGVQSAIDRVASNLTWNLGNATLLAAANILQTITVDQFTDSPSISASLQQQAQPNFLAQGGFSFPTSSANNDLDTIASMCSNPGALKELIWVWSTFAGLACLLTVSMTVLWQPILSLVEKVKTRFVARFLTLAPSQKKVLAPHALQLVLAIFKLGAYCWDVGNDIRLISIVWYSWPGKVLLAIFLGQMVLVTAAGSRSIGIWWYNAHNSSDSLHWRKHVFVALVMCPLVVIIDVVAAVVHLMTKMLCCSISVPLYLGGNSASEAYFHSRHLLEAIFEALPSSVLTSIVYVLGNHPDVGYFLDRRDFLLSVTSSQLSLLLQLFEVLHEGNHGSVAVKSQCCGARYYYAFWKLITFGGWTDVEQLEEWGLQVEMGCIHNEGQTQRVGADTTSPPLQRCARL